MYLSKDSLAVEIVSSKSSEMNVLLPTPDGEDYVSIFLQIFWGSFRNYVTSSVFFSLTGRGSETKLNQLIKA